MDKELSPAKDIRFYALGFVLLLAPIIIFQCLGLAEGEFFAIGSYVISSQSFVKSIISSLTTLLGSGNTYLLDIVITLLWFLGGIVSLVFSILSIFVRSWSHRRKLAAICVLAGYILTYAWIDFYPPQRQIEYALHSKIPSGSNPEQVAKVLSSQGIHYYVALDRGIISASIPYDNEGEITFFLTFQFTNKRLRNFNVVREDWDDPSESN